MPFFPFLEMTPTSPRAVRPGIDVDENGYALPKNPLPLPPPVDGTQSTNALDGNLIAQLEAAKYGQSMNTPSVLSLEGMGQPQLQNQVAAQPQENIGLPRQPMQKKQVPQEDELSKAYGQQISLQNEAIKQAEEQLAAARSKPQQLDLSPLIALSQSWSQKPNALLAAYQRPDDQAKTVQALQEAVLKARGGAASLAAQRAKDVKSSQLEEQQIKTNEELKRAQLEIMKQQKAGKGDLQDTKFRVQVEKDYNKELGAPIKKLGTFVSKVKDLKDYLSTKGEIPYNDPKYKALVSQIVTQYNQDVANLGALAGADLRLLMNAVGQESTGVTGAVDTYFRNKFGGGVGSAIDSLSRLEQQADERVANETESLKSSSAYPYLEKLHTENVSIYNKSRGLGGQAPSQKKPVEQMTDDEVIKAYNAKFGGKK